MAPPDPASAVIVKSATGSGGQSWVGSPSAVRVGDEIVIAYRLRDPAHRGYAVEIARSADGVRFQTLLSISKEQMDCESLERPALVLTGDGTWRLYLSCATIGTKHWRVELLEAPAPEDFDPASRQVVLPGDSRLAVKDPVVATSADGVTWTWHGPPLTPRPGQWDARGVRITAVRFTDDGVIAFYDGRATAEQNCEERTGLAAGAEPGAFAAIGRGCVAAADHAGYGLRYLTIVDLGDGRERLYYELTNARGSHDLVTELRRAGVSAAPVTAAEAAPAA